MQKTRYRGIWLLAVDEKIPRGKWRGVIRQYCVKLAENLVFSRGGVTFRGHAVSSFVSSSSGMKPTRS